MSGKECINNPDVLKWQEKLSPVLLQKYLESVQDSRSPCTKISLEYHGSFRNLHPDIVILSVIEHQLQVNIPLNRLPALASMRETSCLCLA